MDFKQTLISLQTSTTTYLWSRDMNSFPKKLSHFKFLKRAMLSSGLE